ncbi:MAG: hypothetical protein PHN88_04245 [Ignavibacteria bacterium]|nr:hypothetical protein [Ignavibacteria bacterium]
MKKRVIFDLLRTFTKKELRELKRYLNSPYFNSRRVLVDIYEELLKYYPKFDAECTEDEIFDEVRANCKIIKSSFIVLISYLTQQIQNFVKQKSVEINHFASNNLFLNELRKRNLNALFLRHSKMMYSQIEKDKLYYQENIFQLYKYHTNIFNYKAVTGKLNRPTSIKKQVRIIDQAAQNLTLFYITETVCYFLNAFEYLAGFNLPKDKNLPKLILGNINLDKIFADFKNSYKYEYILEIYMKLLKMYADTGKIDYYKAYKASVETHFSKVSKSELSFLYARLISYCIGRVNDNKNVELFRKELYGLYKTYLEHHLFKTDKTDYLPDVLFRAILLNALSLHEYDWTKLFIDKYSYNLNPTHAQNMFNYSNAILNYKTGNYRESVEFANKVNLDVFVYKYDLKFYQLFCYYELGDYDAAKSILHNYESVIRYDKMINKDTKNSFVRFLKYYNRLLKSNLSKRQQPPAGYLNQKLHGEKDVIYKEWLIEKTAILAKAQDKMKKAQ